MLWINIYYSCDVTKCPIEPGPFVLTLDNINDPDGNHLSVSFLYIYALTLALNEYIIIVFILNTYPIIHSRYSNQLATVS